jgi:predicted glycoside hydrolase/deacetylase ChbG (UPF0249 family)
MAERLLIVNADDFGLTPGVNAGIARAHEQGILTSASLMVRWPAAQEAASYAAEAKRLGVGLHVDLGEWEFRDDAWTHVYEVVDVHDAAAVEAEIRAQLDAFRQLMGRDPTHIDSHQHIHQQESQPVFRRIAAELGVPLRGHSPGIRNINFHGQTKQGVFVEGSVTIEGMLNIVTKLSPGITEVGCHPGIDGDTGSVYDRERSLEVEILCDPRVRAALDREGVGLRSFADVDSPPPA